MNFYWSQYLLPISLTIIVAFTCWLVLSDSKNRDVRCILVILLMSVYGVSAWCAWDSILGYPKRVSSISDVLNKSGDLYSIFANESLKKIYFVLIEDGSELPILYSFDYSREEGKQAQGLANRISDRKGNPIRVKLVKNLANRSTMNFELPPENKPEKEQQ